MTNFYLTLTMTSLPCDLIYRKEVKIYYSQQCGITVTIIPYAQAKDLLVTFVIICL